MISINCIDFIGEYKGKLEGYFKLDDFFGVVNFLMVIFKIIDVVSCGIEGVYKIIGNLIIKEIIKLVCFNVQIVEENGQCVVIGVVQIDCFDFDVCYGFGSFFDNFGDNIIYDEFDLDICLVFN